MNDHSSEPSLTVGTLEGGEHQQVHVLEQSGFKEGRQTVLAKDFDSVEVTRTAENAFFFSVNALNYALFVVNVTALKFEGRAVFEANAADVLQLRLPQRFSFPFPSFSFGFSFNVKWRQFLGSHHFSLS